MISISYADQRNAENLQRRIFAGVGAYGIPQIEPVRWEGACEFVPFHTFKRITGRERKGVHFFLDDYQFTRIWTNIDAYTTGLAQFRYVMAPDFSTYTDWPMAIQIYNHYRKHWTAAYLQERGARIIPTISWSTPESFAWCFDGEPVGGCVAVSSVGCMNGKEKQRLFLTGYEEMMERLKPETIIFYGDVPKECRGDIVRINPFQEKFTEVKTYGR